MAQSGTPSAEQMAKAMEYMYAQMKTQEQELERVKREVKVEPGGGEPLTQQKVNSFFAPRPTPPTGTVPPMTPMTAEQVQAMLAAKGGADLKQAFLSSGSAEKSVQGHAPGAKNGSIPGFGSWPEGQIDPRMFTGEYVAKQQDMYRKFEQQQAGLANTGASSTGPAPAHQDPGNVTLTAEQYAYLMQAAMLMNSGNLGPVPTIEERTFKTQKDRDHYRREQARAGKGTMKGNVFPPAPSMTSNYRYYYGEEQLIRAGIFAGWQRFEKEFPSNQTWVTLRGKMKCFGDLEEALTAWFAEHETRNSVTIFR